MLSRGHSLKHRIFSKSIIYTLKEFWGFPDGSADKESTCNVGDLGSIPGSERSPGEGNSYPLQYFGLENPMDYIDHGLQRAGHD